jgi:hypothetical protein
VGVSTANYRWVGMTRAVITDASWHCSRPGYPADHVLTWRVRGARVFSDLRPANWRTSILRSLLRTVVPLAHQIHHVIVEVRSLPQEYNCQPRIDRRRRTIDARREEREIDRGSGVATTEALRHVPHLIFLKNIFFRMLH